MATTISEIEAHAHAALPPLNTEDFDGWQLRFADGHTRRANSVNVITESTLPLLDKITHCEASYFNRKQPCHFRLTPLADREMDAALSNCGYVLSDPTDVLIQHLEHQSLQSVNNDVFIETKITTETLDTLGRLTNLSLPAQSVFMKMLKSSDLGLRFATIRRDNKVVACGLGAVSTTLMGLFEFATDPDYRRQGLGALIVRRLLADAANSGATTAYLQAVQSNTGGVEFWNRMGFTSRLYSYHYRSKL
jgi:ribosomal protein S18 acetylase RimI-like enzyme